MKSWLIELDLIILRKIEGIGPVVFDNLANLCEAPGPISYHSTVESRIRGLIDLGFIEVTQGELLKRTDKKA